MFSRNMKSLALGMALSVSMAGGVMAQTADELTAAAGQTTAGDVITNKITSLQYGAGDGVVTVDPTTLPAAPFRVDRKIDLILASTLAAETQQLADAGVDGATVGFRLANLGNAVQHFGLSAAALNTETPTLTLTQADDNSETRGLGEFTIYYSAETADPATSATLYDGTKPPSIIPGGVLFVYVVANVPATAADNQFADLRVTATAVDGNGAALGEVRDQGLDGVNIIFADDASNSTLLGTTEADGALNGQDADDARIRVTAPVIAATKRVIVVGELDSFPCGDIGAEPTALFESAGAIPGACVEYTITVTNSSANGTPASDIAIADELPLTLTYATDSDIVYSGDDTTGAATTTQPRVKEDDRTVETTIGTLPAGVTATFRIRATIN